MRFVYLDEAGISNPAHEPWVVVAGPIIHADKQWRLLEQRLSDLADEYAPDGQREGFVFHAKELWSGGKVMKRGEYEAGRRWEALLKLCQLPEEFGIPLPFGAVHRATYQEFTGGQIAQPELTLDAQLIAFTSCITTVEAYMRQTPPEEVATITFEQNDQTIALYRNQQRRLKSKAALDEMAPDASQFWPLARIVDQVNFCEKSDTSLLQIADVAAFVLKKKLCNHPEIGPYWEALSEHVTGFRPVISRTFASEPITI